MQRTAVSKLIKSLGGVKAVTAELADILTRAGVPTPEHPTAKAVERWSTRGAIRDDMRVWMIAIAKRKGVSTKDVPALNPVKKLLKSMAEGV